MNFNGTPAAPPCLQKKGHPQNLALICILYRTGLVCYRRFVCLDTIHHLPSRQRNGRRPTSLVSSGSFLHRVKAYACSPRFTRWTQCHCHNTNTSSGNTVANHASACLCLGEARAANAATHMTRRVYYRLKRTPGWG